MPSRSAARSTDPQLVAHALCYALEALHSRTLNTVPCRAIDTAAPALGRVLEACALTRALEAQALTCALDEAGLSRALGGPVLGCALDNPALGRVLDAPRLPGLRLVARWTRLRSAAHSER
jgi:hypothetical protein